MKKILILSLAYYPHVGGAEVAIREITDRIAPEDFQFHMVTRRFSLDDREEEQVGNILVHRVGSGDTYLSHVLFIPRAAMVALRLHREAVFDGAWAMMSYMLFPLVLLRLIGIRIPYALTLQEGDTYEHMFKRVRIMPFLPLLSIGFRNARVVQAISTYLGGWARSRGFAGPLEIIPNGVDVQKFSGAPTAHEGTVLFTASRLVHKNAIDDIIRALPLLPVGVRLVIAGVGKDAYSLKQLVAELQVSDRVQFLGHIDHAKLPALLHGADIFIRPSRSEGMGNSFVEAMAAGVPVIATQEGGIVDFLFDAKRNPDKPTTGWAVDKDSPQQIADAVRDIIAHPEKTRSVVETAKAMAIEKYDWDIIARAMEERVFKPLTRDA